MRCIPIVLLMVISGGCDQAKEAAKKADQALDSSQVDALKEKVTKVKANLAAGRDSLSDCASGLSLEVGDAAEARAAYEALRGLCGRDVPLAKATRIVSEAEKARAERPAEQPLQECFADDWDPTTAKARQGARRRRGLGRAQGALGEDLPADVTPSRLTPACCRRGRR